MALFGWVGLGYQAAAQNLNAPQNALIPQLEVLLSTENMTDYSRELHHFKSLLFEQPQPQNATGIRWLFGPAADGERLLLKYARILLWLVSIAQLAVAGIYHDFYSMVGLWPVLATHPIINTARLKYKLDDNRFFGVITLYATITLVIILDHHQAVWFTRLFALQFMMCSATDLLSLWRISFRTDGQWTANAFYINFIVSMWFLTWIGFGVNTYTFFMDHELLKSFLSCLMATVSAIFTCLFIFRLYWINHHLIDRVTHDMLEPDRHMHVANINHSGVLLALFGIPVTSLGLSAAVSASVSPVVVFLIKIYVREVNPETVQ